MTLYCANPTGKALPAMIRGDLGFIDTPAQGNYRPWCVTWCADNSRYGRGWPGHGAWFRWLATQSFAAVRCLFATAPDVLNRRPDGSVVGDAAATIEESLPWLPRIRDLGYPAALVGQDGLEDLEVPWAEFDVLFLGGSTEWKLGPAARALVGEARQRGLAAHMGRVNSWRRMDYAAAIGCATVDGTTLIYEPDVKLPEVLRWARRARDQPPLFDLYTPVDTVGGGHQYGGVGVASSPPRRNPDAQQPAHLDGQ